MSLVFVSVCV